ncbi:MAG: SDR family oxidoreductase [Thermaerobacter sp.]|nr:SDR family oxidoreductase [Thermaerobacter sp.]
MMDSESLVVVTGGAQGIGRAITEEFLSDGRLVVVVDCDADALAEMHHPNAICRVLDVGEPDQIAGFRDWLESGGRKVDLLVNNAGIGFQHPIATAPVELWDRVLAVNLRGPYLMVQACLGAMTRAAGASVVNIASTRALMSQPHTEAYSASKGGVLALTHALAISLAAQRIRVNVVVPGWIVVDAWQKAARRTVPRLTEADHSQHPSGRVGEPEDVARAVRFLSDPANTFINGAHLVLDGGMTVKMIYAE